MLTVGVAFHVVAAVIWVGGMFFALIVLRPSTGPLDPPVRLALWQRVFSRFFQWVWAAVVVLLVSGFAMVIWGFGGFSRIGTYVHIMMGVGILMVLIYGHLYFVPWPRFRRAVDAADWPTAAKYIDQIRLLVTINLIFGLITVVVGAAGRYYG
jgi:uncharacterized membrane protein